ncbi:MAG: hypothetical protein DRO73_01430 [Candidatus Thorarchaeota archaeon]|nr:MAG: hypothetical protein DRO73_01430 [Candidatus Thorarchaeota archaeon]
MNIECESCGGDEWIAKIYELRVWGTSVIYSALKCKKCGTIYPLCELGRNVSRDSVASMMK